MDWGLLGGEEKCTEKGSMIIAGKETEGIVRYTAALGEWRERKGKF